MLLAELNTLLSFIFRYNKRGEKTPIKSLSLIDKAACCSVLVRLSYFSTQNMTQVFYYKEMGA